MTLILVAIVLILCCALVCVICGSAPGAGRFLPWFIVPASVLGLAGSVDAILREGSSGALSLPSFLPLGKALLQLDPLAGVFLVPVFLLSALAALVAPARMRLLDEQLRHGRHAFFFCLLIAGMALIPLAADGIFFLLLWEIMSLAPFFLLSHSDKTANERFVGWIYLVAAHLGALPLLLLFASLTAAAGASDFASYQTLSGTGGTGVLLLLAFIGFGAKCGIIPLHMWMPEAHSSAPGHVAVLLSGTMLNMGLYGIFRMASLLGPGDPWWAYTLMGVGAFSGVLGILLGAVQSDMKRTLAYSSAENMGIICMTLGAALLAGRAGASSAMLLLLAGALLHMWNHSLFKSLLFLAANAVKEGTHTTCIQHLGGLHKRLPVTGGCFALGAAAIAGIPPFNGFMSEMLVFFGFTLSAQAAHGTETALLFWAAFFVLAGIAGLALFAFTRLFGLAFLGAPRGQESLAAHEPESSLRLVMLFLAASCVAMTLAGPLLLRALRAPLQYLAHKLYPLVAFTDTAFQPAYTLLDCYALLGLLLLLIFLLTAWGRRALSAKNPSENGLTWDCGYSLPTARMQYTGGSFAHSLALLMQPLVQARLRLPPVEGFFPSGASASMETPDWPTLVWNKFLFRPIALLSGSAKNLQSGLVNLYILYILLALLITLLWTLGWT
jgi:formate hydrogenlyase subunit 3/multisubunit Na+/H+ antiporter MnhD subunit